MKAINFFFLEGGSILHIFFTYFSKHFMQMSEYTQKPLF